MTNRTPRSELRAIIEAAALGHPVSSRVMDELAKMQATLHARQEELAQRVLEGKISRKEYIAQSENIIERRRAGWEASVGPRGLS